MIALASLNCSSGIWVAGNLSVMVEDGIMYLPSQKYKFYGLKTLRHLRDSDSVFFAVKVGV